MREVIQEYAHASTDDLNEREVAANNTFVHDYFLQVVDTTATAVSSPISVVEGVVGLRQTALRRRLAELASPARFRHRRPSRTGLFFLRALTTTTANIDYDEMMSRFRLLLDLASDAWESPSDIPEEYTNEFLRRLRVFLCSSIGDSDISHMHSLTCEHCFQDSKWCLEAKSCRHFLEPYCFENGACFRRREIKTGKTGTNRGYSGKNFRHHMETHKRNTTSIEKYAGNCGRCS